VGTVFNFVLFRYRKGWWQRYNYVLSAAMDAGVAVMGVLLYFALGGAEARVVGNWRRVLRPRNLPNGQGRAGERVPRPLNKEAPLVQA
jgi:hypothetical protein